MHFSDSDLRALKAGPKRMVVGAGNSLFVVVESVGKGGGKSFHGITRFPPGGGGKRVEVRIGPYGRGAGKWTLLAAGTHKDLEQGGRARSKGEQKGAD